MSLPVKFVVGQEIEQIVPPPKNFSQYQVKKKNPWLAVGAAWLVPTLGHAYAEDWQRGIKFFIAEAACYSVMIVGSRMKDDITRGYNKRHYIRNRFCGFSCFENMGIYRCLQSCRGLQ